MSYKHKAVLTCPYCSERLVVEDNADGIYVICWSCELQWNDEGMPSVSEV